MELQFVYILLCSDNTYYTGCTKDINQRLIRHQQGQIKYTSTRLPVKLIHYSAFVDMYKAFEFEKYLKTGSGKAFRNKRFL